jgi:DNA-binding CsgD family transcriptional regulator
MGRAQVIDDVEQRIPQGRWTGQRPATGRPLSPREHQIHCLIASGLTRKEVAFQLEISSATVRVIFARAMKKMGSTWGTQRTSEPNTSTRLPRPPFSQPVASPKIVYRASRNSRGFPLDRYSLPS